MLQMVLDGQTSIKKELIEVKSEMKKGFKEVNKRLDTIGSSVAYLEDDTPTVGEYNNLEKRVGKLEKQVASA